MQQLIALLDEYHRKNGYYPAALTDLSTLLPFTFKVGLQSITLTAVPSKDLWGNDYYYKSPGLTGEYDLVCLGSDGQPGSTNDDPLSDDISSAAEGSMIATWFDYTPTGAMDIQILRVVADE
jgi:general secretion pathway protein G